MSIVATITMHKKYNDDPKKTYREPEELSATLYQSLDQLVRGELLSIHRKSRRDDFFYKELRTHEPVVPHDKSFSHSPDTLARRSSMRWSNWYPCMWYVSLYDSSSFIHVSNTFLFWTGSLYYSEHLNENDETSFITVSLLGRIIRPTIPLFESILFFVNLRPLVSFFDRYAVDQDEPIIRTTRRFEAFQSWRNRDAIYFSNYSLSNYFQTFPVWIFRIDVTSLFRTYYKIIRNDTGRSKFPVSSIGVATIAANVNLARFTIASFVSLCRWSGARLTREFETNS